jgi:hypothetical protein
VSLSQKLCADCQHMQQPPRDQRHGPLCAAVNFARNPVTGAPEHNCDMERRRMYGLCGTQALMFSPRRTDEKKPLEEVVDVEHAFYIAALSGPIRTPPDSPLWALFGPGEKKMETTTTDSQKDGVPRANVLAMYNRAKGLALSAAWLGKADNLRFGQGGMNFLDALLRDVGATHAAARDASNGGYIPSAGIEAAWAALPKRAENSSLAQMQKFLAAHGIELAPDAVTRCNLDGVADLEDHEFTTVNAHDEQPAPGIDVRNGTNQHSAPLVQTPIVKESIKPITEQFQDWRDARKGIASVDAKDALLVAKTNLLTLQLEQISEPHGAVAKE